MGLGAVIEELLDAGVELGPSLLGRLSGLLPDERGELRERWPEIPASRREEVVREIVRMADDDIELDFLPVLCVALQDGEAAVRASAASGLWETGDRTVIKPLAALLGGDESSEVRAAAAAALGHFVDLAEEGKLIERDVCRVREALLAALENEAEALSVRRRALEALAPMQGCGVEEWVRWAYRSSDALVRQSAVYAMGRTCDPAWLSVVLDEMESADPAMRYEAANASRELADSQALPHLHELVSDQDAQVAQAAVHAIGGIGGAAARKLLRHYQEHADAPVSEAASEALQGLSVDESDFSMMDAQEP